MKIGLKYRSMHCQLSGAITFNPTVEFSSSIPFQKLEVKIFLGVSRSNPSEEVYRWRPLKDCRLVIRVGAIKGPKHLQTKKKKDFPRSYSLLGHFLHTSSLFQTHCYTQKHLKINSKPLDSSLHKNYKVLFLYPTFFPLVLHLGFEV